MHRLSGLVQPVIGELDPSRASIGPSDLRSVHQGHRQREAISGGKGARGLHIAPAKVVEVRIQQGPISQVGQCGAEVEGLFPGLVVGKLGAAIGRVVAGPGAYPSPLRVDRQAVDVEGNPVLVADPAWPFRLQRDSPDLFSSQELQLFSIPFHGDFEAVLRGQVVQLEDRCLDGLEGDHPQLHPVRPPQP